MLYKLDTKSYVIISNFKINLNMIVRFSILTGINNKYAKSALLYNLYLKF